MGRHKVLVDAITPVLGIFLACANLAGPGSGSDTPNSISGALYKTDGTPATNVSVQVLPSLYDIVHDPALPPAYSVTTDGKGEYRFAGIDTGTYNISAVGVFTQARALVYGIHVSTDSVTVPVETLRTPGAIKIVLADSISYANGYFYVPGTAIDASPSTGSGFVMLDSVPAGTVPVINYAVKNSAAAPKLVRDSVIVAPGGVTTVANVAWKYLKKLSLNTTASGANVSGTVENFPVLVRLNAANFNFSQTQASGNDIRFTKSNGVTLPYEIERWDAGAQQAEVWVNVDTIYGNDNAHQIIMYWGNSTVASASSGAAVFDTSHGFQGVWHMNETSGAVAKDATGNHYDGTPSDTAPSAAAGAIGTAQRFNGMSNSLQMVGTAGSKLNFPENSRFTVSAWVYVDTLIDSMTRMIIGKGHKQYYLKVFSSGLEEQWEFTEFIDNVGFQISSDAPVIARSWKFLVGVHDGTDQYLYLDGVLVNFSSSAPIGTAAGLRDTTEDVSIGRSLRYVTDWNEGYAFFDGAIDEVRISNIPRSADWIKLSYMNQKADGDALVVYK
jgi:hypothetical protein